MFIDYVTLLLVNMGAGFIVLAAYLFHGLQQEDQRGWAVAFAAVGMIALLFGTHMCWTWPLAGPFNVAFGETSVLLGTIFLAIAACVWRRCSFAALGIYTFFAGGAAVVLGARIADLGLTMWPGVSALGFILSGLAGMLFGPATVLKQRGRLRSLTAGVLILAAIAWLGIGYLAYWMHIDSFQDWQPNTVIVREAEK
ncbi:MAG: DUF981 family protein [Planctomycetota bacterium]